MTSKTIFISQLSYKNQMEIRSRLEQAGLDAEDIEVAMDSRLCDLADTIDITLPGVGGRVNLEKTYTLQELYTQLERMATVEGRHKTWQRIKALEKALESARDSVTPAFY